MNWTLMSDKDFLPMRSTFALFNAHQRRQITFGRMNWSTFHLPILRQSLVACESCIRSVVEERPAASDRENPINARHSRMQYNASRSYHSMPDPKAKTLCWANVECWIAFSIGTWHQYYPPISISFNFHAFMSIVQFMRVVNSRRNYLQWRWIWLMTCNYMLFVYIYSLFAFSLWLKKSETTIN